MLLAGLTGCSGEKPQDAADTTPPPTEVPEAVLEECMDIVSSRWLETGRSIEIASLPMEPMEETDPVMVHYNSSMLSAVENMVSACVTLKLKTPMNCTRQDGEVTCNDIHP